MPFHTDPYKSFAEGYGDPPTKVDGKIGELWCWNAFGHIISPANTPPTDPGRVAAAHLLNEAAKAVEAETRWRDIVNEARR